MCSFLQHLNYILILHMCNRTHSNSLDMTLHPQNESYNNVHFKKKSICHKHVTIINYLLVLTRHSDFLYEVYELIF